MALSRGELQAPQFGASGHEAIDGLELLAKSRMAEREGQGRKGARGVGAGAGAKPGASGAKQMMSKEVLSSGDFKRMRKLQLQKSVEVQLGRKRKAEEMSDSSQSESDSDVD